jgi:hypothetical protein
MEKLKDFLEHHDNLSKIGVDKQKLIDLFQGIDVNVASLQEGVGGLCAYDRIFISRSVVSHPSLFLYVALHELAHYKRIQKMGFDLHLSLLSSENFDTLFEHVVTEEIIADRYASYMFFKLSGITCDEYSQNLHRLDVQNFYKPKIKDTIFGKIKNNLDDYNKAVNCLILDVV